MITRILIHRIIHHSKINTVQLYDVGIPNIKKKYNSIIFYNNF